MWLFTYSQAGLGSSMQAASVCNAFKRTSGRACMSKIGVVIIVFLQIWARRRAPSCKIKIRLPVTRALLLAFCIFIIYCIGKDRSNQYIFRRVFRVGEFQRVTSVPCRFQPKDAQCICGRITKFVFQNRVPGDKGQGGDSLIPGSVAGGSRGWTGSPSPREPRPGPVQDP